jgi:deoxyribodipyrimidine photo-lyase
VDFILRTLTILQRDLEELNIPLHIEHVEPRREIPSKIVEFMKSWNATELFANIEYEIDELDRDTNLISEAEKSQIKVTCMHDQCIVEPGTIFSAVVPMQSYFLTIRLGNQCQFTHHG